MLSAFTARPIVELKQRDKSKIESILAYGDRVLVGLNTGSLRIYRVNDQVEDAEAEQKQNGDQTGEAAQPPTPKARPADLLREEDKFSRRPIQQLAIIKEANILVSLSDNYVSIHDIQTYTLQERLEKTRGATTFAAASNIVKDPSTGIPSIVSHLAVAVKRKIILWTWQDMELTGDAVEMSLIASVKSLTWATGTKIVAGMDPGFVMVDIDTQEIQDIIKPGALAENGSQGGARFGAVSSSGMGYMGMGSWVPKPLATRLGEGEVLLAKDVNSLFIDTDGNALDKRQVPWQSAPETIAYSYPYMLTLQPPSKGNLEIRNPDTLSLLQLISLPNVNFLHVPQPNISLAHAGKGFLVASDRCIWRMGAQSYETQIDELVANGRYDEALSLLNMLEDTLLLDKEERMREIQILKAQALFDMKKYREAMELFIDAKAPPERVIAMYPRSIAGNLAPEESVEGDGSVADEEEPNGEKPGKESEEGTPTPVSTIGRSMMGRFGVGGHKKVDSDAASIRPSAAKDESAETGSIRKRPTDPPPPDKAATEKEFKDSVRALQSFLTQCRVQIKRYIDTEGNLKEALPTASGSQLEAEKPPFHIFIEEVPLEGPVDWKAKLLDVAQLVDTTLFRAYMIANPSVAGSLFRLPNFCEPDVVQEKLYETGRYADLIDFLHGKKMHRQALELLEKFGKNEADEEVSPALQGPQRTVGYLQALPPELINLILEYAEWPLRTDAALGMEVFLADTENAETLPRDRVLEFLQNIDVKLAVRYLEHIIEELNDLNVDFHQRLVDLLLERLKSGDFDGPEDKADWRERLQVFLKNDHAQYNRYRVFQQLPGNDPDYYEARAIVLSKMGSHKQALAIYVFQLKDYKKAEEYCNQVYTAPPVSTSTHRSSQPATNIQGSIEDTELSIYHVLLSLYLSPPPPNQPNWPPALELLSKHGARLPAATTLDLIPPTLPVKDLESYFFGRIRNANSLLNEERIVSHLRGVEKVAVEAAMLLGADNKTDQYGRKVPVLVDDLLAVRLLVLGVVGGLVVCHFLGQKLVDVFLHVFERRGEVSKRCICYPLHAGHESTGLLLRLVFLALLILRAPVESIHTAGAPPHISYLDPASSHIVAKASRRRDTIGPGVPRPPARLPAMPSSSPPPATPTIRRPVALDDSDSDDSQATLQQQRRSPLPASALSPSSAKSPTSGEARPAIPPPAPAPQPHPAQNYSRPAIVRDATQSQGHIAAHIGHRPRQRSQGYFEPSLSSMKESSMRERDIAMAPHSHLNASQIAAQAAYAQNPQHFRKRSTTIPAPNDAAPAERGQPTSPPTGPAQGVTFRTNGITYQSGVGGGGGRMAATSAANAAFPRSPLNSPGIEGSQQHASPKPSSTPDLPLQKPKEGKSKMKLFSSKPKNIKVDNRLESKTQALPSPGKIGIGIHSSQALNRMMMAGSTTSLVDPNANSANPSLYSSANASTSTLVPPRNDSLPERKEEKHKHHFLSRQKHKLKDQDGFALPLSSASSNSKPTNPSAPEPLYSFAAPSSPGHTSTFAGSVTGLDLRHGGRHLRRAKKEEKAAAYLDAQLEPPHRERNQSFSTERSEWPSLASSITTTPNHSTPGQTISHTTEMLHLGSSFGINGLSPDDAWPLLKARVLLIFEGEDPRPPVEDFNALVTVHIKRCIHKRSPIILIEDLNELLQTGFGSLDQTLRHVPDDRLIPHLVEMWLVVFTTILPFLQAVFLPLDLEFRGSGIMSSAQAAEFWGVMLPDEMNTKSPDHRNIPILGELEVRRITLLMFRDIVILPRYEALMAIFSRLSLENLNAGLESPSPIPHPHHHHHHHDALRPGTAGSTNDTAMGSLNSTSQSSAGYLESTTSITSSTFASTRSRATSNTSAGSFSSNPSQHPPTIAHLHPPPTSNSHAHPNLPPASLRQQPMDSTKVTETVGRMLQCVSVLVSLQSSDDCQEKIGRLNKELKYNWLGRGRTGRQRQGFVGPRSRGGGLNLAAGGVSVPGVGA
ncbi:vacuolar morphogenesis protein [Stemphylium lycopersici]|nr:vacuolar morphogenesis protein [Stemphylium lycopersici]